MPPPLLAQALPSERLVVRKDAEGNVLDPHIATELLQEFSTYTSPRRLTIQIRTEPDYDPFAMGADDELAALIGARHAEAFRQLRERIPPHLTDRSLVFVKELLPLPLAIVEVDVDGLSWLIDEAEAQVLYQDVSMRLFLSQTLPQIQAGTAHSAGATGSGHTVAVLDTGIQRSHPMFSGKIVEEVCFASDKSGYDGCPLSREVPAVAETARQLWRGASERAGSRPRRRGLTSGRGYARRAVPQPASTRAPTMIPIPRKLRTSSAINGSQEAKHGSRCQQR